MLFKNRINLVITNHLNYFAVCVKDPDHKSGGVVEPSNGGKGNGLRSLVSGSTMWSGRVEFCYSGGGRARRWVGIIEQCGSPNLHSYLLVTKYLTCISSKSLLRTSTWIFQHWASSAGWLSQLFPSKPFLDLLWNSEECLVMLNLSIPSSTDLRCFPNLFLRVCMVQPM